MLSTHLMLCEGVNAVGSPLPRASILSESSPLFKKIPEIQPTHQAVSIAHGSPTSQWPSQIKQSWPKLSLLQPPQLASLMDSKESSEEEVEEEVGDEGDVSPGASSKGHPLNNDPGLSPLLSSSI